VIVARRRLRRSMTLGPEIGLNENGKAIGRLAQKSRGDNRHYRDFSRSSARFSQTFVIHIPPFSPHKNLLSCPRFLKVPRFLKIRNIGFPHHICTLGYFEMSVHSVYKVVCKVYLKKIHQVLVEQQEN
jgi:hypothetical protein